MTTDILIRFLHAGLINVGGDDTKFEKLQESAGDLAAALKKAPGKASSFALIAFDPSAPADDPVITEALEALQKRWATYMNTFSGTPVAVIRSMLLQALAQAAADDDKVGVAFTASARNALPFVEAGHEREIWIDVVGEIERRIEARAEAEWATPESITLQAFKYTAPEAIQIGTSPVGIKKEWLTQKMDAAVGPNNPAGQPTSGNPYWPNQGQAWSNQFSPKLAEALAEAFAVIGKGATIAPIDLSEPLNALAQAVSAHVDGTLKAVSGATAGLQRRTNLIWWKESLYSPSACITYRALPTSTAAALMAFDLHKQIPSYSPASVAAFLNEVVFGLPSSDPAEQRSIRDLLIEAMRASELGPLRQAAAQLVPDLAGRGPLLGLLGHGATRPLLGDDEFRSKVGVPANTQLTTQAWATWLFRELQAARAAQEGMDARKQGRKAT